MGKAKEQMYDDERGIPEGLPGPTNPQADLVCVVCGEPNLLATDGDVIIEESNDDMPVAYYFDDVLLEHHGLCGYHANQAAKH